MTNKTQRKGTGERRSNIHLQVYVGCMEDVSDSKTKQHIILCLPHVTFFANVAGSQLPVHVYGGFIKMKCGSQKLGSGLDFL